MDRRAFIATVAVALLAAPLAVKAQPAAKAVIGFRGSESPALFAAPLRMFRQGLSETPQPPSKRVCGKLSG